MKCRHCKTTLKQVFADLQYAPISNDMLREQDLDKVEPYYPLKVFVCHECFLVQLDEFVKADGIFRDDYTYFSSFSKTWVEHTRNYSQMMIERYGYDTDSLIMEIASNDGCLLENFVKNGIPVVGVEPTSNTATEAIKKGVNTEIEFFSTEFVNGKFQDKYKKADLIIGNNVLAHVPDINDFVRGMKLALAENGVITMEFPHLKNLVQQCQFDTIYHEHFSYLSLIAVKAVFEKQGLQIFNVEEVPTHGGSLRIFAKHSGDDTHPQTKGYLKVMGDEQKLGMDTLKYYEGFQSRIEKIKYDALKFLIEKRESGKRIIGYGAASKGNTLLNYCGVKGQDLIKFVVDASPTKQDKFLPGSHIPVVNEAEIKKYRPDYVIILPWNLESEIRQQLNYIEEWGGQFVTFIPELKIFGLQ